MAWITESSPELVICIPHLNTVSFDWTIRFSSLQLPNHRIVSESTAAIDLARERAIKNALSVDPEWLMFIDTDVYPPKDVYKRLRQHELDVVSAVYHVQKGVIHPAMWNLDNEGMLSGVIQYENDAIVEADAIGLGCCLINSRVFEDIEPPYVRWTQGYEEHEWDKSDIQEDVGIGEDFYLCHKIKNAGYHIYVDTSIECIHEKSGALYKQQFFPFSETDVNNENTRTFD